MQISNGLRTVLNAQAGHILVRNAIGERIGHINPAQMKALERGGGGRVIRTRLGHVACFVLHPANLKHLGDYRDEGDLLNKARQGGLCSGVGCEAKKAFRA